MENNKGDHKRPSADKLYAIGKALGVSMSELLGRPLITAASSAPRPPGLTQFAADHNLPETDVEMLAEHPVPWRRAADPGALELHLQRHREQRRHGSKASGAPFSEATGVTQSRAGRRLRRHGGRVHRPRPPPDGITARRFSPAAELRH